MSRTEQPTLRLFVGFGVPSAATRAIDGAIEPWRRTFPDARWVPAVDRHVTLKFLGAATETQLGWAGERLRSVAADTAAFPVRLTGLGCFPSPDRARVLWVGLDDRAGRMAELALSIEVALAPVFPPDVRPFAPHLTVARAPRPLDLPPDYAAASVDAEPFRVETITVFRSHTDRPPPRYEPLHVLAFEHLFE